MADWSSLLGLPLETALNAARAWGCEPAVVMTAAPRRKGEDAVPRQGTLRVIRARENELTVSPFQDSEPCKN